MFLFVSECWVPRRVLTNLEEAEIYELFKRNKIFILR